MKLLKKILNALSSLKVAIFLILLIAVASSIGTTLPQGEAPESYLIKYNVKNYLGVINGDWLLRLQLDHIYSSIWFVGLLTWLSLSLIICSCKRQWPMLQKAMKWVDYKDPKQIQRLVISKTYKAQDSALEINKLENFLNISGWQIQKNSSRIAARKGVLGRVGPILVHFGLIILMIGATFGAFQGKKIERFLAPERSLNISNPTKNNELSIKLNSFKIDRSPNGQPEQFRSKIELRSTKNKNEVINKEISVNHPLRTNGITIYQADWSLAAITIQINSSPKLQIPLERINQLGEQVWGVLVPSIEKEIPPILLIASSEEGPIRVFNNEGKEIGLARPGGKSVKTDKYELKVINIIPSSGILLKYDPGVPIVYLGFTITLLGSLLSIISTKQIWIIQDQGNNLLYIGGLSNRNQTGFANEFSVIVTSGLSN